MSRLYNPRIVLLHHPVPVTIGPGGLAPIATLALLFAAVSVQAGIPVAPAVVLGALGGTASLVAHELGHVRAARKLAGLRPTSVSLIWLGAATRLEGAYESGRDQARVAIAGPRASFAVAVALVPALFLPLPAGVRDVLVTLAALNVAIGALSLVPAKPLDGYKVVIGLTWSLLGSQAAAQRFVRHLAFAWLGVEAVATAILLVERPLLGGFVVIVASSLAAQRLFARPRS